MRIAVIVTTYNRPDALAAVLAGYAAQRDAGFELLVADDGSTGDTRRVVETFKSRAAFPVAHIWHEDRGFRAAAIRNRALAATSAEYIVFSDGDCVPAQRFVAQHRMLAERAWFVAGNRILLSEDFTRRALRDMLPTHERGLGAWLAAWVRRDINRWLPLVTLGDGAFRKRAPQRWEGVKTCNLAAWRDDLLRVNGLDESYSGWGLEDSDLVIRLLHAGVRHKSARFAAPVFHLWHEENDRSRLAENRDRLDALINSRRITAELGVNRYQ
ncbi:MAG: glycosyltransferase family 2 protein [Betaproteobacteria bacterium]|nr:glycosyltransferase family 2 protein [Betaproteobacteria bacterium]